MDIKRILGRLRPRPGPHAEFWSDRYLRHNQRRQEHLASLGLPLTGRTVLEVGAGIGDHSSFFLDRGCRVVITEGREKNLAVIRRRYPGVDARQLDLDHAGDIAPIRAEVVYCYGTLYHLQRPAEAIAWLAGAAEDLLLLETCVSLGDGEDLHPLAEPTRQLSQAVTGVGCRPTRSWVRRELARHFRHVYLPTTQPWHEEFPVDWTQAPDADLARAVFVASHSAIASAVLTDDLPTRQTRH